MTSKNSYDLIIIGGGAAAFSAAIKASIYNMKTAMIERGVLGGTCVNVGCVPSKNLLGAGEILHSSKNPPYPSISSCEADFNLSKAIEDKDQLIEGLRKQKYYDVLSGLDNVDLIEASASFISDRKLRITDDDNTSGGGGGSSAISSNNGRKLEAHKFIIATGSAPSIPGIKGIDSVEYLTNKDALSLKEKPSSMIVVGGGPLGLEFAQMYSRFGTKVTLLQKGQRIIPGQEPEVSEALAYYLSEEGIEILTGVDIKEVHQKNGTKFITTSVNHGQKNDEKRQARIFEAKQLLMATGRKPNTSDLHLENAGVKINKKDGAIIVDSEMRTSAPHIWAGGDVVGKPMLETLSAKEGATAAENAITGSHKEIDFLSVPSAVFTSPQVATVGLTEEKMMEKYGYCSCKTLKMSDVPKALTVNETKGLIKMAVDPKKENRIVGVHILADIAADMIHEAIVAVKHELTLDDIIDTVHVFPTMTEAIKLVATAFKQDISKLSCCAE